MSDILFQQGLFYRRYNFPCLTIYLLATITYVLCKGLGSAEKIQLIGIYNNKLHLAGKRKSVFSNQTYSIFKFTFVL